MRTLSSLLSSLLFCVSSLQAAEAIVSRDAQIDNVQLHYLTAGHGSATVICCTVSPKLRGCGGRLFHCSRKSLPSSHRICLALVTLRFQQRLACLSRRSRSMSWCVR